MNVNTRDLGFIKFNGEEMNWVKFNGLTVYETWEILSKSGIPPFSFKSSGANLINYKIYGNSIQEGIPTPETPIEVESIGIKTHNLYDKKAYPLVDNRYIDYTNGRYIASTTNLHKANEKYYPIKPNTTYSLNYRATGGVTGIAFYDENYGFISGVRENVNFTTPSNTKYIRFTVPIEAENIQLNEGSTILDFVPFGYKIPVKGINGTEEVITNIYLREPLRKQGDYIDYIDFENNKVYRPIQKKYIKDLNWTKHPTYANIYSVYDDIFQTRTNLNPISNLLDSTAYAPSESISKIKKDYCLKFHATSPSLYISDSVHTTKEEMLDYLGDGEIIYIASTPTEETIELPEILTTKGTCILEIGTKTQPSNMEIVYQGKE